MKFEEIKNRNEEIFKDIDKAQRKDLSIRTISPYLMCIRHNSKLITKRYNKLLKEYNKLKLIKNPKCVITISIDESVQDEIKEWLRVEGILKEVK